MPKSPKISRSEWEVMEVLWGRGSATAQDVCQSLRKRKRWSDRTVKTLLARLVKKGAVDFEAEGKRYLYAPRISRDASLTAESRSFLARLAGGSASPLLATFVREAKLDEQEIAELKRILAEKEARR
jgi:BlaI family penicillinase repressor